MATAIIFPDSSTVGELFNADRLGLEESSPMLVYQSCYRIFFPSHSNVSATLKIRIPKAQKREKKGD